jgi:hypothetical protein
MANGAARKRRLLHQGALVKKIHEREFLGELLPPPQEWSSFVALLEGSMHVDKATGSRLTPEYLADRLAAGFDPLRWRIGQYSVSMTLIDRLIELGDAALFAAALPYLDLQSVVLEKRVGFKIVSAALKETRHSFAETLFAAGIAGYDASALQGQLSMPRFEAGLDNLKATGATAGLDELARSCIEKDAVRTVAFLKRDLPVEGDARAQRRMLDSLWRLAHDSELIKTVCERYDLRRAIATDGGVPRRSPMPSIGARADRRDLDFAVSLGLQVDGRDENGYTGLMREVSRKQALQNTVSNVSHWISLGADVNATGGKNGEESVLRCAVGAGAFF